MGAGEGIINGEDVIGIPGTKGFLVDDAGALADDLRKLLLVDYDEISSSNCKATATQIRLLAT